jgi:hypothetical protein
MQVSRLVITAVFLTVAAAILASDPTLWTDLTAVLLIWALLLVPFLAADFTGWLIRFVRGRRDVER